MTSQTNTPVQFLDSVTVELATKKGIELTLVKGENEAKLIIAAAIKHDNAFVFNVNLNNKQELLSIPIDKNEFKTPVGMLYTSRNKFTALFNNCALNVIHSDSGIEFNVLQYAVDGQVKILKQVFVPWNTFFAIQAVK
jgi:hypothetical protein